MTDDPSGSSAERCEACRNAPVAELVEDDEGERPFRLCAACARRLQSMSLRPLEWYRLAVLHGTGRRLLGDEYYDSDGTAIEPEAEVEAPERYPMPTLESVSGDLKGLIDFALVATGSEVEVREKLAQHDSAALAAALRSRMRDAALAGHDGGVIALAQVLGPHGAELVRECWERWTPETLLTLPAATVACLPAEEAFALLTGVLEDPEARARTQASFFRYTKLECYVLAPLRSPRVLDWMEAHPDLLDPENQHWGRVAAISGLSWPRAQRWLGLGLPWSRIALSGIVACFRYDNGTLMEYRPKLQEAPPREELLQALDRFLTTAPTWANGLVAAVRAGEWELGQLPALE